MASRRFRRAGVRVGDGRGGGAYRGGVDTSERECALCGKRIDVGEAWMRSDEEDAERVAHSGCVYSEAMDSEERAWWVPSEYGPNE